MCRHIKNVMFIQDLESSRTFDIDEKGEIEASDGLMEIVSPTGKYSKWCYDCSERTYFRPPFPQYIQKWIRAIEKHEGFSQEAQT